MTESKPPPNSEKDGDAGEKTYEVGFGKPPVETRFKPGNTFGKGRRKGSKNMKTVVREALEAKVPARINGATRKMAKIELAMHQLANRASSGDLKAIGMALEAYERHGPLEEEEVISDDQVAYDLATLRHLLMMKGEIDLE